MTQPTIAEQLADDRLAAFQFALEIFRLNIEQLSIAKNCLAIISNYSAIWVSTSFHRRLEYHDRRINMRLNLHFSTPRPFCFTPIRNQILSITLLLSVDAFHLRSVVHRFAHVCCDRLSFLEPGIKLAIYRTGAVDVSRFAGSCTSNVCVAHFECA